MSKPASLVAGIALLACASACSPAPPPPPPGPTPAEMQSGADALDQQFLAAFNAGDVEAMMALYWNSPDLVSIGPDGMGTKGWDATRAAAVEMVKGMAGAKIEFLEVNNRPEGDVVLGSGRWRLTMGPAESQQVIEGRYTDVKAMRDGRWVYLMDHASVPLPPPPAAASGS